MLFVCVCVSMWSMQHPPLVRGKSGPALGRSVDSHRWWRYVYLGNKRLHRHHTTNWDYKHKAFWLAAVAAQCSFPFACTLTHTVSSIECLRLFPMHHHHLWMCMQGTIGFNGDIIIIIRPQLHTLADIHTHTQSEKVRERERERHK